jgi:hypothetical protein
MEWVGIEWQDPLILLRLFLTAMWLVVAGYAGWVWLTSNAASALAGFSLVAALLGAASYFIGASTTFTSEQGFMWITGMLAFTPIALIMLLAHVKKRNG